MGWKILFAFWLAGLAPVARAEDWSAHCEQAEQLLGRGLYSEAGQSLTQARQLAAFHLAVEDPRNARIEMGLGRVKQGLGAVREAESHYLRALSLVEKGLGLRDPQLEEPLLHLGQLYIQAGQISKAERSLHRLGQLQPDSSGAPPAATLRRQQVQIEVLLLQHRWNEALDQVASAQRTMAAAGAGSARLESHFWNLRAAALAGLRCWDDAVAAARAALASYERNLPGNPHFLLNYRHNLAVLLVRAGRYQEAADVLTPSIAGSETLLGPDHLFTGQMVSLYGHVLRKLKRKEEAKAAEKRARAIFTLRAQDDPYRHTIDIQALGRDPT